MNINILPIIKEGEAIIKEIKNKSAFDNFTFALTRTENINFESNIKKLKFEYEQKIKEVESYFVIKKKVLENYYRYKLNYDELTEEEIENLSDNNPVVVEHSYMVNGLRELYEKKLDNIENVIS